jgi:AcrR family transcriptional regulator
LFTYFETKTELFNQLYRELKGEMAAAAMKGLPATAEPRERFFRVWQDWTSWAVTFPEKRQALAQLFVSGEIIAESRAAGHKMMADLAELADRSRANGPIRKAPLGFVLSIMNSVAEATMDYMTQDAPNAKKHCRESFDALWRMVE